ncbi:MAG: cytochrome c [Polyangiaceae bacterium]|nr:cytochrome c [Polyangiaceae bacterium]
MKTSLPFVTLVGLFALAACESKQADVKPTAEVPTATAPAAKGDTHAHQEHAQVAPPASASATPAPPPANPVQAEMRALHAATRDWVTAIANNDLASIPTGISQVHSARMVTEKAIEKGEYKPPKAGADMAAFKKQDAAFHDELVKLLKASKGNDLPGATKQLGVVLEGCTSCHVKYRF